MSLVRSSLYFAYGTILSRLSGLVRDMVVTNLLGAGQLHDAFVVAQRIPNLFRDMLAEGALGSSFTKVYTVLKEQDVQKAEALLFQMLYLCLIFGALLSGLGIWGTEQLVLLVSQPKGDAVVYLLNANTMTAILFPSLGMAVLGAVAMGALYQKGRFFLNAIIPILANAGVIMGGFWFGPILLNLWPDWVSSHGDAQAIGLAVGTLLGFLMQMAAAIWNVRSALATVWRELCLSIPWSPELKSVLRLMGPAAIAASAAPINAVVNTNFATAVGPGAVTWLTYAFRILQLPIGIFGVAVGVSALPALTRAVIKAGKKIDENVAHQLQFACELVTWLLAPCMIYVMLNHRTIIELLFHHGRYTSDDVTATGQALLAYSLSMLAYGLIKVLTPFYFAVDRTSFAMRVSLFGILINLIGNVVFAIPFGHLGLALTSSLTLTINSLALLWGTRKSGMRWQHARLLEGGSLLILGSAVAALLQYGNLHLGFWLDLGQRVGSRWSLIILLGAQAILLGFGFGLVALKFWSPELKSWLRRRSARSQ